MDLREALTLLNIALTKKQPEHFGSSWIFKNVPRAYHFFRLNVRTVTGEIDWDAITGELDKPFHKRWTRNRRPRRELLKLYRSKPEVEAVFKKYQNKQYVFITAKTPEEWLARDKISIALVRIAQKGNIRAQQELTDLLTYTVQNWTERYWYMSRWKHYTDLLPERIETCMRRYRFTGSFIQYLFITLLYSARALNSIKVFSLDKPIYDDDEITLAERVVQDPVTGDIKLYEPGHLGEYNTPK